jgi:hypothetical protein
MTERKNGLFMLGGILFVVLSLALSLVLNARLVRRSEQGDCGTLKALIAVYKETPPTTPTGVRVAEAYVKRYADLGCEG